MQTKPCQEQEQLHRSIRAFNLSLNAQFLHIIAQSLDKSMPHIHKIGKCFDGALENIRNSSTLKQFKRNIQKQCKKLTEKFKFRFPYQKICKEIIENKQKLKKSDNNTQTFPRLLMKNVFQCQDIASPSINKHKFENLRHLKQFLEKLNIDINSQIKPQAHKYLVNPHKFPINYGGVKNLDEIIKHNGRWLHNKQAAIQLKFVFKGHQDYVKGMAIRGQKDYVGTIKINKCVCGYNNMFSKPQWTLCHSCSHYNIDYPYAGTRNYQINEVQYGNPQFQRKEKFSQKVNIPIQAQFTAEIPLQKSIQYGYKQIAECSSHHSCSCQILAQFLWSTKEVYHELLFYYRIIKCQQSLLRSMAGQNGQNQSKIKEHNEIQKDFEKMGLKLPENEVSITQIGRTVHNLLCQDYSFNKTFRNEKLLKIQQQFQHTALIKQQLKMLVELHHKSDICYSGNYKYAGELSYKGTVSRKICLQDCRFCHVGFSKEPYKGKVDIVDEGRYFGKVPYQFAKRQVKEAEINESIGIKDVVNKQLVVKIAHDCDVTCNKEDQIGAGHHSCSSCQLWAKYIGGLKYVLSKKERLISQIIENKNFLGRLSHKFE